MKRLDKFKTNI